MKTMLSMIAQTPTKLCQSVSLTASIIVLISMSVSLQAEDEIRWFTFEFPEFEKNSFDIEDVESIKAFASENGSYDVTLIDDNGRMVRVDIATEQHWEILPMAFDDRKPSTNVPFFQLSNNEPPTRYLGRVYYPRGGDAAAMRVGQQRVSANYSTPYPVKGGFRGVVSNNRGSNELVYRFQVDSKFTTGAVAPVNLGEFQYEALMPGSVAFDFGRIERRRALSSTIWTMARSNRTGGIACLPLDGRAPFAFSGYGLNSVHAEWDPQGVVFMVKPKTLVVLYDEGIVQLSRGRNVVPFTKGYKLRTRGQFVKSLADGARFTILLEGPGSTRELWSFDTGSLEIISKLKVSSVNYDAGFDECDGTLAVQSSKDNGDILIYQRHDKELTKIGRTSPLTAAAGRAEQWALSDDGKVIFFVSRPDRNVDKLKFGWVSVETLKTKTDAPKLNVTGGFAEYRQEDLSFGELPTEAPQSLVGILPPAEHWWEISPDDRWVVGNGNIKTSERYDLQLFDVSSKTSHMIPDLGGDPGLAFSADSSLLVIFDDGDVQVWNVAGKSPFMVASSAHLPKDQKQSIRQILQNAKSTASYISKDCVATTNSSGSVRFKLSGSSLKLTHNSDFEARHASYSADGNTLAVWKDDGAVWQYEWDGADWKGKSKTSVVGYNERHHRQARMHSMDSAGLLAIYSMEGLTIWNNLSDQKMQPLTTIGRATNALGFDTMMDWTAISENQKWIVSIQELDNNRCVLSLWDRNLEQLTTRRLPFRFRKSRSAGDLLITNDGKHAVVCDYDHHAYVIRL